MKLRMGVMFTAGSFLLCMVTGIFGGESSVAGNSTSAVASLQRAWKGVERWSVVYSVINTDESSRNVAIRKVLAVKAPGSIYDMVAHSTPDYSWREDPYRQEVYLCDNHRWVRRPFNRTYRKADIELGSRVPQQTRNGLILMVVPAWPVEDYRIPHDPRSGAPLPVLPALESGEFSLVREDAVIDGKACAMFEKPKSERIWISRDNRHCVVKREILSKDNGEVVFSIETREAERVAGNVWVPVRMRARLFSYAGDVLREVDVRVMEFNIGDNVSERVFEPALEPGALELTEGGGYQQVVGGGRQAVLSNVVKMVVEQSGGESSVAEEWKWVWGVLGLCVIGAVGGGVLARLGWERAIMRAG